MFFYNSISFILFYSGICTTISAAHLAGRCPSPSSCVKKSTDPRTSEKCVGSFDCGNPQTKASKKVSETLVAIPLRKKIQNESRSVNMKTDTEDMLKTYTYLSCADQGKPHKPLTGRSHFARRYKTRDRYAFKFFRQNKHPSKHNIRCPDPKARFA